MTASPTFVATFDDGTKTRMTVWHDGSRKTFDLGRGVRLAVAAYKTRKRANPPSIREAHFERDGTIVQEYDAQELKIAAKEPAP
jgi:hypothetical protein